MKNCVASTLLLLVAVSATQAASVATPTCGGSTSSKNINLVNPTNPPRECEYHIKAYSKYVCQLRIDWEMNLAQPTLESNAAGLTYAECTKDYFVVNGLKLCGTEVWQHIYVPFRRRRLVRWRHHLRFTWLSRRNLGAQQRLRRM